VIRARISRARIEAGPQVDLALRRSPAARPGGRPPPIGAAVGFTPLVRARNLADEWGVRELYVKNDSVSHPTCSFQGSGGRDGDRKAREFGFDTVACASTGNLANSVAAHAAEARLASLHLHPGRSRAGKVIATLIYAPTVVEVQGTYDEVNRLCAEVGDRYHLGLRGNINLRPYYRGGLEDVRVRDRRTASAGAPPRT